MTQTRSAPSPLQPEAVSWPQDEIDLLELGSHIWQRKWLIFAITALFLVFAAAYLALATPIYESTTRLRPPLASQLVAVNESGQLALSPVDAFGRVVFEARSLGTQRQVFLDYADRLLKEQSGADGRADQRSLRGLGPGLQINIDGLSKNDVLAETTMSIRFQHTDPQIAAEIANTLATTAHSRALTGLMDELQTLLATRIRMLESSITRNAETLQRQDEDTIVKLQEQDELKRRQLKDQIAALRAKARQLRADKMTELEEALAIARTLKVTEPATLQMLSRRDNGTESVSVSADLSTGPGDPLYLRGSRMLEAELSMLKQRSSDDHMVPELRDLQEQLQLLEHNRQIDILKARENYEALAENTDALRAEISQLQELLAASYEDVRLARVDQPAIARSTPVRPKSSLVLAIAAVAGLILGALAALILGAAENRRQRLPPEAADTGAVPAQGHPRP